MRHVLCTFGSFLLLGSLTGPGLAQSRDEPSQGSWFSRLLGGKSKQPTRAPEEKPPAADSPRAAIVKAQQEWDRRIKVCDKLRAIGNQIGDEDLLRQAFDLETRAW